MSAPAPLDLLRPGRSIVGMSAVLLPHLSTIEIDWPAFEAACAGRIVLLTTTAEVTLDKAGFKPGDILLLGSEGAGVPPVVHDRADLRVRIPMRPGFRSLNVAVSAGIALAEALRQTGGWPE